MRRVLVFTLLVGLSTSYGPPSGSSNGCGSGVSCGGVQSRPVQTPSCTGNSCGGGSSGGSSGDYWWAGNNPFAGAPASHVSVTSSGGPGGAARPVVHQSPAPQQGYVQPSPSQTPSSSQQVPSVQNLVQPPMGICPASYVCVHWQLCRDGVVISDGTGNINKQIKTIPAQVASRYQSCGGDMICCGIPPGTLPPNFPRPQPQVLVPAPQRPAPQPGRPLPQPARPVPQPARPAPQPARPAPQPARPAPQPARPAPQPARPAPQPARPAPQPARPAPQPARPAPQPARPSGGYGRPPTPQNPLIPQRPPTPIQPNPQPSFVNPVRPNPPPQPQPSAPVSNPIGLVSPPSPQPNPMMGGMMGMMGMMPMRGGSCSAGTYCVQQSQCNPYTGFIIRNPSQVMAVWPDSPTVPLLPCFVPGGNIQNGVCCQEAHPNAGGFD